MGFSIHGYVLEPPRVGQSNSPFTAGPNNFVPQTLLAGIFSPTSGSTIVPTSVSQVGVLVPGNTLVFLNQLGVTYTIFSVSPTQVILTAVYSASPLNPVGPAPTVAYCPQIGVEVQAYNTAYPSDESKPRDDYLVLVTSELAPGIGTTFSVVNAVSNSGAVQLTTSSPSGVVTGQTVIVSGVNGVPGANGTFTVTVIDSLNFILNGSVFTGFFGGGGSVLVIQGVLGLLVNAGFGWTKNEIVTRFAYDAHRGSFRTLPGGPLFIAGMLGPTANTTRLKVPPPALLLADAPFRLSIATGGSGTTFTVVLVANDGAFSPPPVGTAQLSLTTGNLNWNATDLTTYNGLNVQFQQQQFNALGTSTGNIGTLQTPIATAPPIILNPLPATGQKPLIRIGYLYWLTTVEVPNEGAFTPPVSGTVQWARDTGRLHFNTTDVSNNNGVGVYFDGTLYARDLTLPRQSIGLITAPSNISVPVPATGDIIFTVPSSANTPYYQFPKFSVVSAFDTSGGTQGTVEILQSNGAVQFSASDQSKFAGLNVTVVFGDLLIDHGIAIRLYRSSVDLDAQTPKVKDVTNIYHVSNAVLASPIMGSPLVFLPSTPVNDATLQVSVGQGTGTFVGALNQVGGPGPPAGFGYTINFDTNQLNFAQRFIGVEVPLLVNSGHVQLPNQLVLTSNIELALETGKNTSVFLPLTPGVNCLVDALAGLIYFTSTFGLDITNGSTGTFSGTTLTDPAANFISLGVMVGDYLIVLSDTGSGAPAKGFYTIIAVPSATTLTVDVAPPAGSGELSYEILRGKEIMADRFFEPIVLTDPNTSVERITALGPIQNDTTIVPSGSATFPDQETLSDPGTDFNFAGVQPGDTITLTSGPASGSTFLVSQVTQHTLTPTISFVQVVACTYTVTRRLQVPIVYIGTIRFRYGLPMMGSIGSFTTTVNTVATDSAFSPPVSLAQGTVEVSQATGNLNFAQADVTVGGTVFVSRKLALGTDYQITAGIGFIQFSSRLLTDEEVLLSYVQVPPNTSPPTPTAPPFIERGTFLVRKELTQPHLTPTNTLLFNPTNKSVANVPAPAVFRGGRPQTSGQVTVNGSVIPATITFLPDPAFPPFITDALPHGAIVNPNENVYIDYYIYQAMGGELSLTVLNPAILTVTVLISEGASQFVISGNQTAEFPAGFLMTVAKNEVYRIGTATYDGVTRQTTITLSGSQTFQSNQSNPPMQVASGATPLVSAPLVPAYFVMELAPYFTVARGMNFIIIPGDRTAIYQTNVVLFVTDQVGSFTDFYLVSGSQYFPTENQTKVSLTTNSIRQYTFGQQTLSYTVRPVFAAAPTVVHTSRTPITIPTPQPMTVIRRIAGQVGQVLSTPVGYTADSSGAITYVSPLRPNEEFSVFYTGYRVVAAGPRLQANYTATIVPDLATNGLLGQVLNANYTIFSPDSFFWRVETMTIFKGQVAQEITAATQAATPSSGPMTSNTSSPQLYQQGQPSVWFPPGNYANHDIIAQASLKFFNDAVNDLEDVLHAIDGRIVGDVSGRFLFDGVLGRFDYYTYDTTIAGPPPPFPKPSNIYNQIDDYIQVHPGPLPAYPNSLTYFQQAYVTGPISRFFKSVRNIFAKTAAKVSTSPNKDDIVATFNFNPLTSLPQNTIKRAPRAQILLDTPYGSNTFFVDNVTGSSDGTLRPPWTPAPPPPATIIGMMVVIEDPHGNFYVDENDNATVVSVTPAVGSTPAQITITGIAHTPAGPSGNPPSPVGPYPSQVPAGSTIYLSPIDVCVAEQQAAGVSSGGSGTYGMSYQIGRSVNVDNNTGNILYQNVYWPFDGNSFFKLPTLFIPQSAYIIPVRNGDILEADGAGVAVTYTAPFQFSALFGGQFDDDGNQTIPIVGPTFDGEVTSTGGGALNTEATNEIVGSTFRTTTTTPPFQGTGDLDVTRTIITLTSGTTLFPAPFPKIYDLVRITSGTNGVTSWRRITAVQNAIPPATITVAALDAFSVMDVGFNFVVAVSAAAPTGLGTATLSGTAFTDTGLGFPFLAGAVTVLGNTYGVVTVLGNTYNTTTMDTIAAVVPTSAGVSPSPPWGSITQGSPFSIGDIVTGPGVPMSTAVIQLGPGSSVQLSNSTNGGNLTGGVFEIQLTQPPPIAGNITGLGDVPAPTNLDSGAAASVTTFINPIVTITGLSSILTSYVGKQIVFSGAASGGNNGTFTITSVISPTSVTISNSAAVAPDGNNGAISWHIPSSPTIINLASTHGMSIGDLVSDTGAVIPAGSKITQIGPGNTITLTNAATGAFPGDTITVTKVVPSLPWSTTVDSIIPNIYSPTTQASHPTAGFANGTVLSGPGIPYAPPFTTTTITSTSPTGAPPAGWSLTMSVPATKSSQIGDPLTGGESIITVYIPPNVQLGWTIVMLSGPNVGLRRQIASITDSSHVVLDAAFPFGGGGTYRVDNPLNTYDGTTFQQLTMALSTEVSSILTRIPPIPPPYVPNSNSEQNALLAFFTTIFTTLVGPSPNGVVSGVMLTDTTVDFIGGGATPLVNTGDLVYVHLGGSGVQQADEGIYAIAQVVDSHHLMVTPAFPLAGTVTYEVVSAFGVSTRTLQSIFSIFAANATFITQTEAFQALLASPLVPPYTGTGNVPVLIGGVVDTNVYANGINDLMDDLGNRYTQVSSRLTYINPSTAIGPVSIITGALATGDNLYAKRYSWINARINLQTGYLILENTSLAQVAANQQTIFNQLIQLLTVQGS